jgi:hypothetical protein
VEKLLFSQVKSKFGLVDWITIRTTPARWQAELMQQILSAYEISSRVLDIGLGVYCGQGSQAALQVRTKDQWTALLLLSTPEKDQVDF